MPRDRIQKVLAAAGLGGRRMIEQWIAEGRISVNGRPAELGQSIDHEDHVRVDGRLIGLARKAEATRVLLYRKRVGELVTRDDPDGRRTVFRKLPELVGARWIAVGRLDINTSGLLLLTTDGELARRLMHPSFEIPRTYAVRVLGEVNDDILKRLLRGVELEDGVAKCEGIRVVDPLVDDDEDGAPVVSANRWLEVTMQEGRNRIVRRLFEAVGLQVSRLIRIAYGPIALGRGIKTGSYREATPEELAALREAVDYAAPEAPEAAPRRSGARRKPGSQGADERKARRQLRGVDRDDAEPAIAPAAKARGAGRGERTERPARPVRAQTPDRAERPVQAERPQRSERPARAGSPAGAARPQRPDRAERPARSEHAGKPARPGKPFAERAARAGDRPYRPERGAPAATTERAGKLERPVRGAALERAARPEREERPARPSRSADGARPAYAGKPNPGARSGGSAAPRSAAQPGGKAGHGGYKAETRGGAGTARSASASVRPGSSRPAGRPARSGDGGSAAYKPGGRPGAKPASRPGGGKGGPRKP